MYGARISIVCRCEVRAVSFRELTTARFNSVQCSGAARKRALRVHVAAAGPFKQLATRAHRTDPLSGGNESTRRCIICRGTPRAAKLVAQLSVTRVCVATTVHTAAVDIPLTETILVPAFSRASPRLIAWKIIGERGFSFAPAAIRNRAFIAIVSGRCVGSPFERRSFVFVESGTLRFLTA